MRQLTTRHDALIHFAPQEFLSPVFVRLFPLNPQLQLGKTDDQESRFIISEILMSHFGEWEKIARLEAKPSG